MFKILTVTIMLSCVPVVALAGVIGNTIELIGDTPSDNNVIAIDIVGVENNLTLNQTFTIGGGAANTIQISIEGNENGGPSGSAFTGAAAFSGLLPGTLTQEGFANAISLTVFGSSNLFAFLQQGSGNTAVASIEGSGNQAAVRQFGQNNAVSFSQSGTGNVINITQRSR